MLPICLDAFNQAAFLNHFIEPFSGTVLTSSFSTADIQCDWLWDRLADAPGFRRETRLKLLWGLSSIHGSSSRAGDRIPVVLLAKGYFAKTTGCQCPGRSTFTISAAKMLLLWNGIAFSRSWMGPFLYLRR